MESRHRYPQWYRTLRAFVIGMWFGVLLTMTLQYFQVFPTAPAYSMLTQTWVNGCFLVILSAFEIVYGIQRYRRDLREMDGRATARLA